MTTKNLALPFLARAIAVLAVLVAGCAAPPPSDAPAPAPAPTPAPSATPAAPAAAPPLVAAPFADAVARAGERLLQDAQATLGTGPRELVIDPLIDASTGQQTNSTVQMGAQLAGLITRRVPTWNVQPLTRGALASRPLLLIGTLTAINTKNAKDEDADAFRICLVLIDLRTGKLVAKRVDRATLTTVDAEPLALYRESPTWALDATALAYIKSCQGSSPGDAIAPGYLQRLPAQAVINEAVLAYADNKPADAYRLYNEARAVADPPGPSRPQRPLHDELEDRPQEGSGRHLRQDRRHRPGFEEAADQAVLQPGHDDVAADVRPAGPVRRLAAAGRDAGRRTRQLPACHRPHQPHRRRRRQRGAVAEARRRHQGEPRAAEPQARAAPRRRRRRLARGDRRPRHRRPA